MVKANRIILVVAVLLLVALAIPLSLSNSAGANNCPSSVYVAPPPFGDDANPGTQAQPFATIQQGIDVVCDEGTVYVAAGTYFEHLSINFAVNLVGAGAPVTIIDGGAIATNIAIGGSVITISSAPDEVNVISGFTIQNGNAVLTPLNPGTEQVLYAGIKLPSIQRLPQLIDDGSDCGGGIFIYDTHIVTLNDCTIRNNTAFDGGGICNHGQLTMNRCTVSGNKALFSGGGIYNEVGFMPDTGVMTLTNCTISGNQALGALPLGTDAAPEPRMALGGGIFNGTNATMHLLNVTIANNSALGSSSHGGGFANGSLRTGYFKNTIVANNVAGDGVTNNGYDIGFGTGIHSLGHNLDSENTCGFDQPTDLINTNPLLGPLQDNGGPTFTCALLEGSPAIDAGDDAGAPATDQRGVTRPQGAHVDIGAYEFVPVVTPEAGGPAQFNVSPSNPNNWTRNLNPPTMSVAFVSVNPQQAVADQPVTISTNVVNTGDQGGNMSVALKINGIVEQTRMVSVGPQASQPIKFTVTKAQPGTYAIDIGGQTGSFTIPDAQAANRLSINWTMIILLIMAVLAIAIVMVLMLNRRSA